MKPASTMVLGTLVLLGFASPAMGKDEALPRTPWQAVEPAPGQAIRWIVEGCAAYPVVVDAEQEVPAVDPNLETERGMAAIAGAKGPR